MRRLLPALAALLLSLALAVGALGEPLRAPDRWLVGDWTHPDTLSNHWLLAWVAERLAAGEGILHNDRYYWPVGDAPVLAGNGAEGFLYLPFHLALGWPAGVPFYVALVLVLNGLSGWALARAAGAGPGAALVAVGVTGASPYVLQELSAGRFSQASTCWLLFFLASWIRLLRRPSAAGALLSAGLLAVTSFFYWYYGFFGVLAGAALLLARGRGGPRWGLLGAFSVTFLALIAPWAWVFLQHWEGIPGAGEGVFPHPQAALDVATTRLPFQVGPGREAGRAMPLPLWLLGLAGALRAARDLLWPAPGRLPRWLAGGLLLAWALFTALSLGPAFAGAPYTVLYGLAAPLRRFWWPIRHVVVANAAWGVFAALALDGIAGLLSRRWRAERVRLGVAGLAAAAALSAPTLLARQGAPAVVHASAMRLPPPLYPELAALPHGVVVEPPLAPDAAGTQQVLVFQRFHGKPLLTGHALWVDRVRPEAWDAFVADNSFLAAMQRLERGELEGGAFAFEARDLRALLDRDVRWFVLNREHFHFALRGLVQRYDALFDALFGEPVLRAQGVRAWDATRWTGRTRVDLEPLDWPPELQRPSPDHPLVGRRPESAVFVEGVVEGEGPE